MKKSLKTKIQIIEDERKRVSNQYTFKIDSLNRYLSEQTSPWDLMRLDLNRFQNEILCYKADTEMLDWVLKILRDQK